MFNLLPEAEKNKILEEYSARRIIVFAVFLCVSLCIALVSIFPSYVLSSIKLKEIQDNISSVRQFTSFQEADQLSKELSQANVKLSALQFNASSVPVEDLFSRIITRKISGVRLNGIMYKRGATKDSSVISVSGVAKDRESLSNFVTELQKEALFKNVSLPVSSFAKDSNADFTLQITGTF
jgi:Tfp pilus assembly protein PilN